MRPVFGIGSSDIDLKLRLRLAKGYVLSVLLQALESQILTKQMEKKLETFKIYIDRRMLKISQVYRVTNETVLQRKRTTPKTPSKRELHYLGYVMCGEKYYKGENSRQTQPIIRRRKLSRMADHKRYQVISINLRNVEKRMKKKLLVIRNGS